MKAVAGAALLAGAAAIEIFSFGSFTPVVLAMVGTGVSLIAAQISESLTNQRGMGITVKEAAGLRQTIYGTQRVGGVLLYESSSGVNGGGGNFVDNQVIAVASHTIDGFANMYADGRQVFWSQTPNPSGYHANVGCGTVSTPPVTAVTASATPAAVISRPTMGEAGASGVCIASGTATTCNCILPAIPYNLDRGSYTATWTHFSIPLIPPDATITGLHFYLTGIMSRGDGFLDTVTGCGGAYGSSLFANADAGSFSGTLISASLLGSISTVTELNAFLAGFPGYGEALDSSSDGITVPTTLGVTDLGFSITYEIPTGGVITGITASTLGDGFCDVAPQDGYRVRIYDLLVDGSGPGPGQGAEAWAVITDGAFVVTVDQGGWGYLNPQADIQGKYTFGGTAANSQQDPHTEATATISGGAVTSVGSISTWWLDSFRYPLNCTPLVVFSGGGGYGAAAHCVMSAGHIASIVVDDGGELYTSAPTVTIGAGWTGVGLDNYAIGPAGDYSFGGKIFCEPRFGDQPTSGYLKSLSDNDPAWTSTCFMGGIAGIYVNFGYDTALFSAPPEIRITVSGKPVYDYRTSKIAYSANPALQYADVITDPVMGLGDAVNVAQTIAAANVCDEQVMTVAVGLETRYANHIHYDTSTAPGDAIALILPSMGGRQSRIAGEFYVWPAYWQGSSYSFDSSVFTADVKWEPYRSQRDLFNRVSGVYTATTSPWNVAGSLFDSNGWYYSESELTVQYPFAWQPTNYPMYACDAAHGYTSDAFLAADRNIVLPTELALRGVISMTQAQRLGKIHLLRNRQQGTGEARMSLTAWQMIPTSVMEFTCPELSWSAKLFEVDIIQFTAEPGRSETGEETAPALGVLVKYQETAESVYEWNLSDEQTIYSVEAMPGSMLGAVAPPTGLTLANDTTAATGMLSDGTTLAQVVVNFTPPADSLVNVAGTIQVQYQMLSTGGTTQPPSTLLATPLVIGSLTLTQATAFIDAGSTSGNANYFLLPAMAANTQAVIVQVRSVRPNGATGAWVVSSPLVLSTPPPTWSGPVGPAGPAGPSGNVTVVAKSAAYTAVSGNLVLCTTTSASFAVTLPAPVLDATVSVKKVSSDANTVTITPASGLVEESSTLVITTIGDCADLVCDGTNWFLI
jgi:hypothetical protein